MWPGSVYHPLVRLRSVPSLLLRQHPWPTAERIEITLSNGEFAGSARVRTVTGTGRPSLVPGVEEADLVEGSEDAKGSTLVLVLPASSFSLVEADLLEA